MLILMFVVILIRLTIIQIEKKFSILEYAPHNTLLVGMSRNARKAIKDIRKNPHLLYDLKGYISRTPEQQALENLPYLGRYDDMPEIIRRYGIEEIIIGINERSRDEILKIVAYGENMRVAFKIVPQMYDVISGHKTKEMVDHPLIRLFPDQMRPWQWLFKRAIDILVALIGMLFLTPLISIAVVMQVSSGIYPFFVIENKIGKQGKVFGQLLLNYKDRRKGVGKFLYQTYIYKLPQVINLLLGQVSLVGPRPESPEIVEDLRKRIKFYNRRFLVRPGITGWTQVRYRYTESLKQLKEQFKQDIFYLENMSLLFDFQIMVRSIMLLIIRKI
jgi:lipopolysaccharide/colanic/teichoic acid biosynthesis glycosyltransferase